MFGTKNGVRNLAVGSADIWGLVTETVRPVDSNNTVQVGS